MIRPKVVYISYQSLIEPTYEHLKQLSVFSDPFFVFMAANDEICMKRLKDEFKVIVIYKKHRIRNLYWIIKELKLLFIILVYNPNIIWYDTLFHPIQVVSAWIFKSIGIRLILSVHDVVEHEGRTNFFEKLNKKFSLKMFNNIIVFSKSGYSKLKSLYTAKNIYYKILPAYSFADFSRKPIEKNLDNRLLFFGSIFEYKNVNVIIECAKILEREKFVVKFVIAGSDPNDLLVKYKSDLIEYHLRFIPYDEVEDYFRNCKALLIPYKSATQSGPICQAYYFEKPVIASRLRSFDDYVTENYTGLLFNTNDPQDLANCIKKICSDRVFYHSLIEKIKMEKYEGKFSTSKQTEILSNIFQSL